jgi:MFS family permease
MTPQEAIYVLSIMNAFGVFGRTAPAYLADIIGHFNILFPAAFFSGLSCLTLWLFATTHAEIMIFAAVYGFWSGAFSSVVTPCVARISEIDEVGTRFGMLFSFVSIP